MSNSHSLHSCVSLPYVPIESQAHCNLCSVGLGQKQALLCLSLGGGLTIIGVQVSRHSKETRIVCSDGGAQELPL